MRKIFLRLINLILISVLLTSCSPNKNSDELSVDIIDVGQGDSSLIITPDRKTMLIDTGEEEFARSVIRDIKKNRIKKLDYILGTHSDSDHIGAADKVIEEIPTDTVILSKDGNIKPDLQEILDLVNAKKTALRTVESGDTLKIGEKTDVLILSPEKITDDPNKNSIVCLIAFNQHRLLFTGDADSEIEKRIIRNYNLPHCTFLKVGHHGSKTASSEEFISTISPDIASISCGYRNRYKHPSDETVATLKKHKCNIYRTDELGTLHFYFGPEGVFFNGD